MLIHRTNDFRFRMADRLLRRQVNSGIADGAAGGTEPPVAIGAPTLTRSTFHARILLNQRSCHWLESMSNETVSSSPI